jgi:hypothetical protein
MKPETIQNCFIKALIDLQIAIEDSAVMQSLAYGLNRLRFTAGIQELMDLNQLLNPADEEVYNASSNLDERILREFNTQPEPEAEVDAETDEELEVISPISHIDAIEALEKLRLYKE